MQSSTAPRKLQAGNEGNIDGELVARLFQELQSERENSSGSGVLPAHLKEFLDTSPFQLKDVKGEQEVRLTRNFGHETINVAFSISALNDLVTVPDDYFQDLPMHDIDVLHDSQASGTQTNNATKQGGKKAPEHGVAPADGKDLMDNEGAKSYPVPINIIIEKEGVDDTLAFDVFADDGDIQISRIYYYSKKERANVKTVKHDYTCMTAYTGPVYGNLDEDLQRLMENYLRERGINTTLAQWVPEYIDFKEQREYMKWLSDVKSFIER